MPVLHVAKPLRYGCLIGVFFCVFYNQLVMCSCFRCPASGVQLFLLIHVSMVVLRFGYVVPKYGIVSFCLVVAGAAPPSKYHQLPMGSHILQV